MLSIMGSLGLAWPVSAQYVVRAFSLDMIKIPGASCLFEESEESPFWMYVVSFNGAVLALLGTVSLVLLLLSRCRMEASDSAEFLLSILFAVQLPFSLNLASETMQALLADGLMSVTVSFGEVRYALAPARLLAE